MLGIINMKKKKKFKLGTWITSFNPDSLEIIASFKFDWIAVDLEHSTISFEQLSIMISIIQKTGTEAWVRVGKNDEYLIKKTLDLGPEGLIIPMINNSVEAQKAIEHSKYPPHGKRSFGYCKANMFGIQFKKYITKSKKLKILLQIDLSGSINDPGNFNSIKFKKLITKYEKISLKRNIPMGYHQVQIDQNKINEIVKKNYKYICIGTDIEFLINSYKNFINTFNKK